MSDCLILGLLIIHFVVSGLLYLNQKRLLENDRRILEYQKQIADRGRS